MTVRPCDRLNGIVCATHCTSDVCRDGEHVDLCLGPLPAPRTALSLLWRHGVNVTPELAEQFGQLERALR